MSTPTLADIQQWLPATKGQTDWANFLHGLPWHIIRPLVQIAVNSHTHPALALGTVAITTGDAEIRRVAHDHLAAKDPGIPAPPPANRAGRRAARRSR